MMNVYFSFLFLALSLICACSLRQEKVHCRYTSTDLLRTHDSSLFEKKYYQQENLIEFLDLGSRDGVKGIYKFDENKVLRFYAFLLSDSSDYVFSRSYDDEGHVVERSGREVIQWYFRKLPNESIKITFYMFCLRQCYKDALCTLVRKIFKIAFYKQVLKSIHNKR